MAVPADVRTYIAGHDLTSRSRWQAAARTAVIASAYGSLVAVGFAADRVWVWLPVWAALGCILVGAYSAMHESAHGMLTPWRRVNRAAGAFWASTILFNFSLWRSFHLEHHAHTGAEDDPEWKYKMAITHPAQYLLLIPGGLAFIAEIWWQSLGTLFGRYPAYVRTRTGRRAMQVDAVVLLCVTVGLVTWFVAAPGVAFAVWGAPFLVTAAFTFPFTAINEHHGCATEGSVFETTRTVVSNPVFRFLAWNTNYHVEHHLVPSVPFNHTHALHGYIEPRIQHQAPSYVAFHRDLLRSTRRHVGRVGTEHEAPAR